MVPTTLPKLAGRVPQRWRRRVRMRLRHALVARLGHPGERFDPAAHPARPNLGCGYDKRAGYLNIDLQGFDGPRPGGRRALAARAALRPLSTGARPADDGRTLAFLAGGEAAIAALA